MPVCSWATSSMKFDRCAGPTTFALRRQRVSICFDVTVARLEPIALGASGDLQVRCTESKATHQSSYEGHTVGSEMLQFISEGRSSVSHQQLCNAGGEAILTQKKARGQSPNSPIARQPDSPTAQWDVQ
ncbi:hypothetical protein MMC07_006849 [Pseudocyphellaria aurata]|nr:hypothetical protein [Pseudocyphellaria aurata]